MNVCVGRRGGGGGETKKSREEMGSGPSSACRATKKGKKVCFVVHRDVAFWATGHYSCIYSVYV